MTAAITTGTDFSQFAGMRAAAQDGDPAVLREVAGQFEALFMQTMLKNMRAGQLAEPLFGSEQHEMYLEMMDQQLAIEMSRGQGLGFADMLVRQLGGEPGDITPEHGQPVTLRVAPLHAVNRATTPPAASWANREQFTAEVWPHVERAAERLGVAPKAVLAQAALESGWGEHVMRYADGTNSYNLFGVKTGTDWYGGSVVRQTLEFSDGLPEVVRARFRAYPDLEATFADYTRLLTENPRYANVLQQGDDVRGFAEALKQAGYATDPRYAEKIVRISESPSLDEAMDRLKERAALPTTTGNAASFAR